MSHFRGFVFCLVCATPSLPPSPIVSFEADRRPRPKATPSPSSCWKCKFRGAIIVVVISGKEGGGEIFNSDQRRCPPVQKGGFLSLEPRCPNVRDIPLFLCMGRYMVSISSSCPLSSSLCTHRPPPRSIPPGFCEGAANDDVRATIRLTSDDGAKGGRKRRAHTAKASREE